jgi:anti-sigma B factor antagonist
MDFTVNTRRKSDVVVVDMSGRLGAGDAVLLLRNAVRGFMQDGSSKFVLNLAQVSYLDSSGLGELVVTYTSARNRQGDVKLLSPSKFTKDLLQVAKLSSVFEIFDDETQAIQSLAIVNLPKTRGAGA